MSNNLVGGGGHKFHDILEKYYLRLKLSISFFKIMVTNTQIKLPPFLDAYCVYNQILMEPGDQKKTTFIAPQGTYYYKVMLFGLKNVGDTYQQLVIVELFLPFINFM